MTNERQPVAGVVGATVCALALATAALLPTTANGPSADELLLLTLPALAGLAGCAGWLASQYAVPTKTWILSLGVTAAWGLVVGGLIMASNWSAWRFHAGQVASYDEAISSAASDAKSSDGERLEASSRLREDQRESLRDLARSKRSVAYGAALVAIGAVAGVQMRKLKKRAAATSA
jgi:hypothetical protein